MLALAITISLLILLALLRFGVIVEYSEEGFLLWAKAGFLKFQLMDKDKKKQPKKEKKEKKKKTAINIKPGSLSMFMDMLRAVVNALSRLKRRLLIKKLILYYTSAGDDPSKTAILFGAANAIFGTITPIIERNFRIRQRDLRASVDFNAKEQTIYVKASISIAVWEVFYIIFALFPIITVLLKNRPKDKRDISYSKDTKDRKVGSDNGKSPNKRIDGDNNAESKGDD